MSVGIKYFTSNTSWYPMYDLEINETNKPINLVYKAVVAQKTGIEWDNVKLTFSSGNPDLYNQAPVLKAWILKYVDSEYLKSLQRAFKDQVMK
ncbi:DUF4139 domain-containing protein [Apibacter raozihei]|uniref:DUF4139 domain-containing protein n=1 Tax=Apibacter raozihei TaxID=2500547 RepID=UPI000FE3D2B6|nr:DUF4139 domain-containing protein [Apibacter raozihei]